MTQYFLVLPPTVTVSSDTVVQLSLVMQWDQLEGCDEDAGTLEQKQCYAGMIGEFSSNLSCLPFMYKAMLPDSDVPECDDETEATQSFYKVQSVIGRIYDGGIGAPKCKRPCTRPKYIAVESRFSSNVCYDLNHNHLWIQFRSASVKIESQYRLMDFATVITAVGGGLGLFLGFSCYGISWGGLKWGIRIAKGDEKERKDSVEMCN